MSEMRDSGLVEPIDKDECLSLLQRKAKVGRVGFVEGTKPMILPVNYFSDGESIVFCTSDGGTLSGLENGTEVAFEIDGSASLEHSGWSVVAHGQVRHVTEEEELSEFRRSTLQSWGRGSPEYWILIEIDAISGRRIPATY
ncbi:pyridoxamine 5'-phosphate oxidase family protein [soil metagenome]